MDWLKSHNDDANANDDAALEWLGRTPENSFA
jgi:hypothetical protein